jgi:pimeloyl-ACP methyl ester carboxylesterase
MKARLQLKFTTLVLIFTALFFAAPGIAHSQHDALHAAFHAPEATPPTPSMTLAPTARNVIIIGFVGGFVSRNDTKHPEVQFAAYLRDRYPSIHADVFGNHHGQKALNSVVALLDTDHDGILSPLEKQQATVIIYGHSWGATETVAFARDLGNLGIPVALTIQVDTIGKPLHHATTISPNVASAINFYQNRGPLHGQPEIIAADPTQTKILGNYLMTYEDRPINCDNYSWYSRTINKPHHLIENDFRVWDELASLINTELPDTPSIVPSASPSASPFFKYLRRGFQAHLSETAMHEVPAVTPIN